MENGWGIFEKVNNSIFYNVYVQPASCNILHILNSSVSEKLHLSLHYNGSHELSSSTITRGTLIIIIYICKYSDFVIYLLGNLNWTKKDFNFSRMSTIKLEQINTYLLTT
jgi:hypothetical protein